MNLMKLSAVSAVMLGAVAASPAVHAHASFIVNGGSSSNVSNLQWLNGAPNYGDETQDPYVGANIPIIGFQGIHGASTSNNRVIETGVYGGTSANGTLGTPAVTTAMLGGNFGNYTTLAGGGQGSGQITPGQGNTYLGQLYNYNTKNPTATIATSAIPSVSVSQGSWGNGVSDIYNSTNASITKNSNGFNTGDSYLQPYAGSGSQYTNNGAGVIGTSSPTGTSYIVNGENYIMNTTGATYLNFSIAADHNAITGTSTTGVNSGTSDLAYAIYQGTPTGPGLQGLVLLGSGVAGVGNEADFSIALTGSYLNGNAWTAGSFTVVVGDASESTNNSLSNYIAASNYDQYYKVGIWESGTGVNNVSGAAVASANPNGAFSTVYNEQGTAAPVPVPGAVWLFGSALAGAVGFGRRKSLAAA